MAAANSIIEDVGLSLKDGLLPLKIQNNPSIHELELENIFGEAWVFIGHESEVSEPGDYARRYIGKDPFIFVRDEDENIRVLFDSCRHRGTQICRAEHGNTSHFRCPYHGWTYDNAGNLVGVPHQNEGYEKMDKSEFRLHQAPRVEHYAGLVFASLSSNGPSLEEYLGDFKWYLDIHFKLSEGGMEVIGVPHRWEVDTNWKIGAENFSGDDYHVETTHQSVFQVGFRTKEKYEDMSERDKHRFHVVCENHATSFSLTDPDVDSFWLYPEEVTTQFNTDRVSEDQYDIARRAMTTVGTVFPNLSLIHVSQNNDPNREGGGFLGLRKWQPIGPGKMQIWSWTLVPKESPPEYKERAHEISVGTFSPSGNLEQDDLAVWRGISTAAESQMTAKNNLRSNYQMGMKSMADLDPVDDFSGPGEVYDTQFEDGYARNLYESWYEYMNQANVGHNE